MKTKCLIILAMIAVVCLFVACNKEDYYRVNRVTLDEKEVTLSVDGKQVGLVDTDHWKAAGLPAIESDIVYKNAAGTVVTDKTQAATAEITIGGATATVTL